MPLLFKIIIVCIGAGDGTEKAAVPILGAVPTEVLPAVPRNKLTDGVDDDCLLPRFIAALDSTMNQKSIG